MKTISVIFFFLFTSLLYAQKPVISIISTDSTDFQFYIGNKEYSEGPDNVCIIKTLPIGKYLYTITFDNDTIADVTGHFQIKQGKSYLITIKPKSKLVKKIRKTGRKIKKNDYNDNKLADYYGVEIKENK